MSNLNAFHGTGNLVRDPELRYTQSGTPLIRFTIAMNNGFGEYRTTTFVDVVGFGKQAEVISKFFSKGKEIGVNGMLSQNNWEDNEGNKRSKLEIKMHDRDGFFFTSGGNGQNTSDEPVEAAANVESGDGENLF